MDWLSCLRCAIQYIEDRLGDPITPSDVAKSVYLSPMYLQNGFQIMTGYSMSEYIRNRRLSEAAKRILETDDRVIDIALSFGYDTPESFTKAFRRFHGVSPAGLRRGDGKATTFLPLQIQVNLTGGCNMDCTVSPMWPMTFIGFERIFTEEEAKQKIPPFWDEICERHCTRIYAGLPAETPEEHAIIDNCIGEYAVCIDDIGGGRFRYIIAGHYTGGEVPPGMTTFTTRGGEWAKFKCVGPAPKTLQKLNDRIFREWLPGNPDYELSDCYNIEWYSCDIDKDQQNYESGIWLPVQKKNK